MLKFNLTQEGKGLIDALQGDAKLAITKVLLHGGEGASKEITSFKGAVCNDGTGNGAYVVIDITDNSNSNYRCTGIELFSDQTKIATQCVDEQSGYEVTLYCGERGRNKYPSITYRTQTWTSRKTPTNIQLSASMGYPDKQCGINMFGGGVEGESATFDFENGNFPKTITFANGDIWVTNETVSAAGVTEQADYYASSEMGDTSIRPLFSNILIQKESNKQLKLRVSCQFDGAEKCKFNTTSINLPYATKFREGVVRLADPSDVYGKDGQRYNTVYSAADVDAKISQVTDSLGNLNQYAKKAEENEFTAANNTFANNITVNGVIGGTAVTDAGTGGDKHIVNVGYADNKYLSKTDAETIYLSKNEAGTTYLTKQAAETTYLTQTDATATYLTKEAAEQAAGNYAKLNVENTFIGAKNTFNEVSATKFSGDGVVDAITTNATQTNQSIPTDYAVKTYVDGKTDTLTQNVATLQSKDNDLQSQIDGINAGQNLADIVNNTTELEAYDVSRLKAKDDFQHGEEGETWAIGDKVQVLGDANVQSSVYELIKGTKPEGEANSIQSTNNTNYYWHYIGVYGTNAYTKGEIDTKVGEINNALDTKANQSYVDTELGKKVDKDQITTTISDTTATDEKIPSGSAVKTYVDGELANKANSADVYSKTEADDKFAVKTGDNTFTGNNTFNGTISGSAVSSAIADDVAGGNGARLTTCTGVSSFVNTVVDNKINDLQLGSSYLKLTSTEKQIVASSVDFNGTIGGTAVAEVANATPDGSKLVTVDYVNYNCAQLGAENKFTGATNTFQAITATTVSANTFTGDGVTASQMNEGDITQNQGKIVSLAFAENRYVKQNAISDKTKIGAMGLFLYTGGDFKAMGSDVHGSLLHAVGMQLPMDGVVSWSQGDAVNTAAAETTWKLLNNTIAGEPCLVLAIRVG